jgi:hypothetical protein
MQFGYFFFVKNEFMLLRLESRYDRGFVMVCCYMETSCFGSLESRLEVSWCFDGFVGLIC